MDSYSYQKKIKAEQKLEPRNPNDYNEMDYSFMFIIGSVILICIIAIILMAVSESHNEDNCEKIGGEYVVVDQQYSGKVIVDIYGCVK